MARRKHPGERLWHKLPRPPHFRTVLAIAMIVTAALGAFAGDKTAQYEFNSAVDAQRLNQGQVLELQRRQYLLDLDGRGREFARIETALAEQAAKAEDDARDLRKSGSPDDLRKAIYLELQAQALHLRLRSYLYFGDLLRDPFKEDSQANWESLLAGRVSDYLRVLGFDVDPPVATAGTDTDGAGLSIWNAESRLIDESHGKAPRLAWCVFYFVLALFFFVLADLLSRLQWLKWILFLVGVLTALAGTTMVGSVISIPGIPMIAIPIGSVILGAAAWRLGLFRWLEARERHHPLEPASPGIEHSHIPEMIARGAHNALGNAIVITLALTVLLSAFAGYCYTNAAAETNKAVLDGFSEQVRMTKLSTRPVADAIDQIDGMVDLLQRRSDCAVLTQEIALLQDGAMMGDRIDVDMQRSAACGSLSGKMSAAIDAALAAPGAGLNDDPKFPYLFFDHMQARGANAAFARWDGYTHNALFWSSKATSYLTVLTLCAITVFLMGQALGMQPSRLALALYAAGIPLALYALLLMGGAARQMDPEAGLKVPAECLPDGKTPTSPMAAVAYYFEKAKPMVDDAETGDDYRAALGPLHCVVTLRPSFTLGRWYYMEAKTRANSPQIGERYFSMPSVESLSETVENYAAIIAGIEQRHGAVPYGMLSNYGDALWHLAVQNGNAWALQESLDKYAEASAAYRRQTGNTDDGPPYLLFNKATAYFSAMEFAEAREWLRKGLEGGGSRQWDVRASTLTDLDTLEANCFVIRSPDDCRRITAASEYYKGALVSGSLARDNDASAARLSNLRIHLAADKLGWQLRFDGFNPRKDTVAYVWYARDATPDAAAPGGWSYGPWRALPDSGGAVTSSDPAEINGDEGIYNSFLHRSNERTCLPVADYRIDIYLNGRLALTRYAPVSDDRSIPTRWRELGLSLCRPGDWVAWKDNTPGHSPIDLVRGLQTKSGSPAVFAFTFVTPAQIEGQKDIGTYFLDRATHYLAEAGVMSADSQVGDADSACKSGKTPRGVLQTMWLSKEHWLHVVLFFADAMPASKLCDLYDSINDDKFSASAL